MKEEELRNNGKRDLHIDVLEYFHLSTHGFVYTKFLLDNISRKDLQCSNQESTK